MKNLKILSDVLTNIQDLKEYINNIQVLENPNQYILGYKFGIVIMNIDKIHEELLKLENDLMQA